MAEHECDRLRYYIGYIAGPHYPQQSRVSPNAMGWNTPYSFDRDGSVGIQRLRCPTYLNLGGRLHDLSCVRCRAGLSKANVQCTHDRATERLKIFVTLWVMVDPKKSISEAFFQTRDNGGGWPSSTLSMLVGQISCIYAVSGCDSSVHRPDEVDSFAVAVPRGIFWSFVLNLPLAFIMLVTYCINFGSTNYALSGHFPPFVAVFQNALHTASVVTAFTSVILVLLIMITISALAATSRQTFAFA